MVDVIPPPRRRLAGKLPQGLPDIFSVDNFLKLFPSSPDFELRDLRRRGLAVPLTSLHVALFCTLLAVSTYFNFTSTMGQEFLSLQGNSSAQTCQEQLQAVTATFLIDYKGRWSTDPKFLSNESIYSLRFDGATISLSEYQRSIRAFVDKISRVGRRSAGRSFIWSSVAWATFSATDHATRLSFRTLAAPEVVVSDATFTDISKRCRIKPSIDLLPGSFKLSVSYPITWPPDNADLVHQRDYMDAQNVIEATNFVLNGNRSLSCSQVCAALPPDPAKQRYNGSTPWVCSKSTFLPNSGNAGYVPTPQLRAICGLGDSGKNLLKYIPAGSGVVAGPAYLLRAPLGPASTPTCAYPYVVTSPYLACNMPQWPVSPFNKSSNPALSEAICPCVPTFVEPCPGLFSLSSAFMFRPLRGSRSASR